MEELFKEFMKYLENASDEELRKNYEELKYCDEIGPTLEEYAQSNQQFKFNELSFYDKSIKTRATTTVEPVVLDDYDPHIIPYGKYETKSNSNSPFDEEK